MLAVVFSGKAAATKLVRAALFCFAQLLLLVFAGPVHDAETKQYSACCGSPVRRHKRVDSQMLDKHTLLSTLLLQTRYNTLRLSAGTQQAITGMTKADPPSRSQTAPSNRGEAARQHDFCSSLNCSSQSPSFVLLLHI